MSPSSRNIRLHAMEMVVTCELTCYRGGRSIEAWEGCVRVDGPTPAPRRKAKKAA